MRAVTGTVGLAEGSVRAVAAGADAICVGGGLADEATVELLAGALAGAVRAGRLREERLADAAARVASLGAWAATAPLPGDRTVDGIGMEAARLAVRSQGRVVVGAGALVVELRPEPSIPAGEVPWGLGGVLAAHDPEVTVLPCHAPAGDRDPTDAAALAQLPLVDRGAIASLLEPPGPPAGRPLVLVVRDLHRHRWQRELVGRLLGLRPDAVVVEMGVPVLVPDGAAGHLCSHGAGRVNAEAAAEVLLGRRPRTLPPDGTSGRTAG
jgi:beta-N-acetylhexosaminidase